MKNLPSIRRIIRLLSVLICLMPIGIDVLVHGFRMNLPFWGVCAFSSASILVMFPTDNCRASGALSCALLIFVISAGCMLLPISQQVRLIVQMACLTLCLLVSSLLKYRDVSSLLNPSFIWKEIEDHSRLFGTVILFLLGAFAVHVLDTGMDFSNILAVTVLYVVYKYLCALECRTMFIGEKKGKKIRDMIGGVTVRKDHSRQDDWDKLYAIYSKVVRVMEEEKPYLDKDLNLDSLSRMVYSNKAYLSRAINEISEGNFKSFVNRYRVMHSIELMKSDPHLQVKQLADRSGFATPVSYSMSFKAVTGTTPGAFSRNEVQNVSLAKLPSNLPARGQ